MSEPLQGSPFDDFLVQRVHRRRDSWFNMDLGCAGILFVLMTIFIIDIECGPSEIVHAKVLARSHQPAREETHWRNGRREKRTVPEKWIMTTDKKWHLEVSAQDYAAHPEGSMIWLSRSTGRWTGWEYKWAVAHLPTEVERN